MNHTQPQTPASSLASDPPHPQPAPSSPLLGRIKNWIIKPGSPHPFGLLPYQQRWINDHSPLKIIEKCRQVGLTYADCLDSVTKVASLQARFDVWVSSRDQSTARQYLDYCKNWALLLQIAAEDLGFQVLDANKGIGAYVLRFASGRFIYALSSSVDAPASRTGHIKLDEFAVHKNQRDLFRYAKPCTQWGGQLAIISTHRGTATVFNEILRSIKEKGNPMGWSSHRVSLHDAVAQGLVEKINQRSGRNESPAQFLARLRAECIDQEHWLQEYCCTPADEQAAFISYEMITNAEAPDCSKPFEYLLQSSNDPNHQCAFYVGVDIARKQHLSVIDVGEKIGDVTWDRLRLELRDRPFSETETELWRILALPNVHRACIDATGLGMQLAERAKQQFGWKVEPLTFTPALKEQLAFGLRAAFEDRRLRISTDQPLRADLRGIRKEVTASGNIRFLAESEDSHCDRFWAKALRQHAMAKPRGIIAEVLYD